MLHSLEAARAQLDTHGTEFARIENPPGVFPPHEMVPLASIRQSLDGPPSALLLDMDGTITCTEPLFLYGVEAVIRHATGWNTRDAWSGLVPERDYPRIVGFSTQRNLEYLHGLHGDHFQATLFFPAVGEALTFLWEHEVPEDIRQRVGKLMTDYGFAAWWDYVQSGTPNSDTSVNFEQEAAAHFPILDGTLFSFFGLVIFYADYLDALERVNRGDEAAVSLAVYGDASVRAVAPMPGVALLCALARGWLSRESARSIVVACGRPESEVDMLASLCPHFAEGPVPVALVTSSGAHETELVLQAVFRAMGEEVRTWGLPSAEEDRILRGFASPTTYFKTIVTCDDVIPGRTKPFRDPYSLALGRLGLDHDGAQRAIGFEDTEVGIIAQRGAGIGMPCALPIEFTCSQDFTAAAHVLPGGVLDAVLKHGLFIKASPC